MVDYKFLFIDDGSTDGTWDYLKEQSKIDKRINAVRLSRNFGKEAALTAGLENANSDAIIILDADLQHPPEIIPEMIKLWQQGYDVVEGIKESRGKESFFSNFLRKYFIACSKN